MAKKDVTAKLDELEIEYDPTLSEKELKKLLPPEEEDEGEEDADDAPVKGSGKTETIQGIEVGDPEILRPRELPLVIKVPKGGWKNDEQAEYAKVLNGYAYKNAKKWKKKKNLLIARLVEIGKDPELLAVFKGEVDPDSNKLEYGSQLTISAKAKKDAGAGDE